MAPRRTFVRRGAFLLTWDYEYDWLDRLEKVTKDSVVQSLYSYDASDNRIALDLQALGDLLTYTYDDANNITEVKKDSGGGAVSIETFTSDDDGNMLTRLDKTQTPNITTTYEWDDFNKLIKVSEFDGTTTTVKHQSLYGINGMRRRKTDSNSVTTTEYSEGLSTAVAKATTSITYIRAHGIAGFEDGSGNFYYFLTDALGSVRSIVNASGVVQSSYDFDEYGNLISTPPTGVTSQKTFVGGASVQDETGDTGLYLMGHRWMMSTLGRFINRDPIGFAGGLNMHVYAGNNPVNFTDPAGLFVEQTAAAAIAAAEAIISSPAPPQAKAGLLVGTVVAAVGAPASLSIMRGAPQMAGPHWDLKMSQMQPDKVNAQSYGKTQPATECDDEGNRVALYHGSIRGSGRDNLSIMQTGLTFTPGRSTSVTTHLPTALEALSPARYEVREGLVKDPMIIISLVTKEQYNVHFAPHQDNNYRGFGGRIKGSQILMTTETQHRLFNQGIVGSIPSPY